MGNKDSRHSNFVGFGRGGVLPECGDDPKQSETSRKSEDCGGWKKEGLIIASSFEQSYAANGYGDALQKYHNYGPGHTGLADSRQECLWGFAVLFCTSSIRNSLFPHVLPHSRNLF